MSLTPILVGASLLGFVGVNSVSVSVSAATAVLSPGTPGGAAVLGVLEVGSGGVTDPATPDQALFVNSEPGVVATQTSGTGLYASFGDGILFDAEAAARYQPFTLFAAAFPSGTASAAVESAALAGALPAGSASAGPFLVASGEVLTVTGLTSGFAYDLFAIAVDSANGVVVASAPVPVVTAVATSLTAVGASGVGITVATANATVTDPDSGSAVFVAAVPTSCNAASVGAELTAGTFSGESWAGSAPPGSTDLHVALSNLAPGARYKLVVAARDAVSSGVAVAESAAFSTFAPWTVDEALVLSLGYSNVGAQVDVSGAYGGANVLVGVIPDTAAAAAEWAATSSPSDADSIAFMQTFFVEAPGQASLMFSEASLPTGSSLALAAKAVSSAEPWVWRDLLLPLRTIALPSAVLVVSEAVLSGGSRYFFAASAGVSVSEANYTFNIYTAVVLATESDADVEARLLAMGSAAYPGAFVDQRQIAPFQGFARRGDLRPGEAYKAVALLTFPDNPGFSQFASAAVATAPLPALSLVSSAVTDSAVELAVAASSGAAFDVYVHITPHVVAGRPQYVAEDIVSLGAGPDTFAFLGQQSYAVSPAFSNLGEGGQYGVVAVADDGQTVLVVRELVVRTGTNPDIDLAVTKVGARRLDYRVGVADSDSSFAIYTAVTSAAFSQDDAEAMVAAGMLYTGSGVVEGSLSEFPNDAGSKSAVIEFTACNLDPDTAYAAVAVTRDAATGVVNFVQLPFVTNFEPTIAVASSAPTTDGVVFDLIVQDRDGPAVALMWKAYASSTGLTADLVAGDSVPASQTSTNAGSGARAVTGLRLGGLAPVTQYYLAVVVETSAGDRALAIQMFTTTSPASVAVSAAFEFSGSLEVDWSASDPDGGALDAFLALFSAADVPAASVGLALAGAVADGTAPFIGRYSLLATPAFGPARVSFGPADGVVPATEYTVVAVARDIPSGDLVAAQAALTTRAEARVFITGVSAVRRNISATVFATAADPVPSRPNPVSVAATVVPRGAVAADADPDWLVAGGSNPFLPDVPVTAADGLGSVSLALDAGGALAEYTAFDVLARATAANDAPGAFWTSVAPVTTRSATVLTWSLLGASALGGEFGWTAAVTDGLASAEVRARAFLNPGGAGAAPDAAQVAVVAASGELLGVAAPSSAGSHTLSGLAPDAGYLAVLVATDSLTGDVAVAYRAFRTSSAAPDIVLMSASTVAAVDSLTVTANVRDKDSAFEVRAAALPADAALDAAALSNVAFAGQIVRAFAAPVVGFVPVAATLAGLAPATAYRVVVVGVDASGNIAHDFVDAWTLAVSDVLLRTEYDGAYGLRWRADAVYSAAAAGLQLGNGKVALELAAPTAVGTPAGAVAAVWLGSPPPDALGAAGDAGGFAGRATPAFVTGAGRPFAHSLEAVQPSFALGNQDLDMFAGLATSRGAAVMGAAAVDIEVDTVPLRQAAFSSLHTVRVTPRVSGDLVWAHEVWAATQRAWDGGGRRIEFGATVLHSEFLGAGLALLEARTEDARLPGDARRAVACSVFFLFEDPLLPVHEGFSRFRDQPGAYARFMLPGLAAGAQYRLHAVVTQVTGSDFADPVEAARRVAVALRGSDSAAACAARLRAAHAVAMAAAWEVGVSVDVRIAASAADQERARALQRALRFAQFTVMGAVREGSLADVSPAAAAAVDRDGSLLWGLELHVIPYLLYQSPRTARRLLDQAFRCLDVARALAEGSGLSGTLFGAGAVPGADAAGRPFWDLTSSLAIFKSAVVAVAAWDYYRVSLDRSWLLRRGFEILAGVADMVAARARLSGGTSLRGVLDLDGCEVDDDAFTNYAARLALKAAMEASYELRYAVPSEWESAYFGLGVALFPGTNVVKANAGAGAGDSLATLHPLLVLQEHYSGEYLRALPAVTNGEQVLGENAAFYASAASSSTALSPRNLLLLAGVYGVLARSTPAHADTWQQHIDAFLNEAQGDVWGALSDATDAARRGGDVALSAQFLGTVVCGLCGLGIAGGTTPSGFHYSRFGVFGRFSTNLPIGVASVRVPRVGRGAQTFQVINERVP